MMNHRFAADLRRHLVETANERPAEGSVAAVVDLVAVTPQRRPVAWLPRLQGGVSPYRTLARYGLLAALLALAVVAGALLAGGSGPATTPFQGAWTTTDIPDGSTMRLYVGAGDRPAVRFEDLFATGDACVADQSKVFTANGTGNIDGNRLTVTYPDGGGCGSTRVGVAGAYVYDRVTDTLQDGDGLIWTRIPGGDGPIPTFPPPSAAPSAAPSDASRTAFEGRWTATDPGDESTLTLIVGAGKEPVVQFQDDVSTGGVCATDESKVFRADGFGSIDVTRLTVSYPDGGGCGARFVPIAGLYDYLAGTDTLRDIDGVIWTRVAAGPDALPTLRPAPTQTYGCVDVSNGGSYTELSGFGAGPSAVTITATVPANPRTPWLGSFEYFHLSDACEVDGTISISAGTGTAATDSACWPQRGEIQSFADALARLDTPSGDDIADRIDLTIDGYAAARYDIIRLHSCSGFGLWSGSIMGVGETGSMYIVDVDGVLVAIELNRADGNQTRAQLDEAYAIVASLQITP